MKQIALRISVIYMLVGAAWILFSDRFVQAMVTNPAAFARLSIYKGWGYVIVTGLLLYLLIVESTKARVKTEEALRANETKYRTLAANFPNGFVLLVSSDYRMQLAEGSGLIPLGLTNKQVEGKPLAESFPSDIALAVHHLCATAFTGAFATADASIQGRLYELHAIPVYDASNALVACTVVALDITERAQWGSLWMNTIVHGHVP